MLKAKNHILLLGAILAGGMNLLMAQAEENIGTQKITVTKSYSPSLSESFKLKTDELLIDSLLPKPQKLEYQAKEIKVVSTFVPNKASPLKLQRKKKLPSTNSQLSLGFGSQSQYLFDASIRTPLDSQQALSLDLFLEGEGDVPNTGIPSNRSQTELAATHQYNTSQFSAFHQVGFERTSTNYYGLYPEDLTVSNAIRDESLLFGQQFYSVLAKSQWQWYDNWLEQINAKFRYTGDAFGAAEQFVHLAPNFRIPLFNAYLDMSPSIDFLATTFENDYYTNEITEYNQSKAGLQIQLSDVRKKFKYKLGAKASYLLNENTLTANQLFVYPEVFVAYSDPDTKMQPYLKVSGNLNLNSYYSAFQSNPFVAPGIELLPTDEKYTGELGFTTLFLSGIEFQLAGQYSKADNFSLFQRLALHPNTQTEGYKLANSFGLIYDQVERYGAYVGLRYKTKNLSEFQLTIQQNNYSFEREAYAWNLPDIEADIKAIINIGEKLKGYASLEFVGNRNSAYRPVFLLQDPSLNQAEVKSLSSVMFLKSEISYRLFKEWNAFIRYRSVFGENPFLWDYTPLNQNLFLLGIRYKFNITL